MLGIAAVSICAIGPIIGPTPIDWRAVFDRTIPFNENVDAQIFFIARLPRSIAGALVGAALASAGVVLQALFRNPLATPFTLGVSSGASLGALVVVIGTPFAASGLPMVPFASFAGAVGAIGIVYALARSGGQGLSTSILLLSLSLIHI